MSGCGTGNRAVPAALAKDFNTSVIATPGYVFSRQSDGEITVFANSALDGKGSAAYFRTTSPDGKASGRIESITMGSDGKITIRGAEAHTGSRVRQVVTIDPEDKR